MMRLVSAAVDDDSKDDEDLDLSASLNWICGWATNGDSDDFQQTQPILKLLKSAFTHSFQNRILTSPYIFTVMIFANIKNTQNIKLSAHPGNPVSQYANTNCNATKSAAVDTASLNQ